MSRVALGLEYAGAEFNGFQRQASAANTVQARLEEALSSVANEAISLVCAGRTDAGVHATAQVVHFDTFAQRPEKAWVLGTNTKLPDAIRVLWAKSVDPVFHARFSATKRRYRYVIRCARVRSAILGRQVTHCSDWLDIEAMHAAAQSLIGEHDFSAFRASQCQAASPVRTIEFIRWQRSGDLLCMDIQANAFLHHMVRNIVGSLMEIGRGRRPVAWLAELLAGGDRRLAAPTASPWGLYLCDVSYPECFQLPRTDLGPAFLSYTHSP